MNDKFKDYYSIIDVFDLSKRDNISYHDDDELDDSDFFLFYSPFNMAVFMRYLQYIIYDMCDNMPSKENVQNELGSLLDGKNTGKDYKWKDISLLELIKGNYNYLIEKFVLKDYYVPNKDYFMNKFCYPDMETVYPFSLREFYFTLLERGISITINNYYFEKRNKKPDDNSKKLN